MRRQLQGIIFVAPEFRLGNFGLLTFEDESIVPRNLELYGTLKYKEISDILAALEWVRDEIHVFGGDSRSVTVAGGSGGGSLTSILTFSHFVHKKLASSLF